MLLSTMIPMTILIIVLLVFFWHYTNEYNQLSNNLAVSSEYNANYRNSNNDMSFKDEVDMDIYYVTIGRKGKDGLPTEQVDKAISTVESLKKTTSKKESLRSLKYLTNYLENLKKRMNQLLEIKNYQERQEFVANNTEILTTLFEKEMQNYIYQEATELVQIESQLAGNVRLTIITMCAAILVATAILLRRSFRLTYSITKPISEILHNIKKVGKGEYKTINAVSADERIKEACSQSSQTTVSKCRIRLLIFDTVKVKSQLFESFFYFTVSAKVDQVVSESTSHQEFHGHIVYDLRILFVISFLCCKPVINDNVFYRVAYCLKNLLLCSFFNCFSIEEFYVVFYAFLECLFLEHFVCHFIPPVMVSLFTLFSAIHPADIAGEPLHSVNSSVFFISEKLGAKNLRLQFPL